MRAGWLGLALLLSACGAESDRPHDPQNNAATASNETVTSGSEPSERLQVASLLPGAWSADVTLVSTEALETGPEFERLKAGLMEHYSGHDICLKPHETARPPQQFFSGAANGCSYDRLELSGGRFSGAMSCEVDPDLPDPPKHTSVFEGTYTATNYSMKTGTVLENRDGSRRVSFVLATEARRTGDC